jgi:predicted DNA-binding transcriptional regulator AlpA
MSIKAGEMARRLGISRMHVGRLAKAGAIPGARRTKGGHWFWLETESLQRRLSKAQSDARRKAADQNVCAVKAALRMSKDMSRMCNDYGRMRQYWQLLEPRERTWIVREMESAANILTEMRRQLDTTPKTPTTYSVFDQAKIPITRPESS